MEEEEEEEVGGGGARDRNYPHDTVVAVHRIYRTSGAATTQPRHPNLTGLPLQRHGEVVERGGHV